MILEVADFRTPAVEDFEAAMRELAPVIASSAGYLGHTVQRCIETPGRYLLIVRWASMEAHTTGFRGSAAFERWRAPRRPPQRRRRRAFRDGRRP